MLFRSRMIAAHDLYCYLLPQCEALRTCRSGFPIATLPTLGGVSHIMAVTGLNIFTQFTASSCKCDVSAPRFLRRVQQSINLSLIYLMQSGSRNSVTRTLCSAKSSIRRKKEKSTEDKIDINKNLGHLGMGQPL